MVLLVLAGIWVAVLLAPVLRARAEGTLGDSIGTFRRHLSVLERTAPTTVSPANRLRTPTGQVAIPPYRPTASKLPRPGPGGRFPSAGYPYAGSPTALRRRQAQKRRRDVLFTLLVGMAGSLLLGLIPSLSVMLWVHVLLDLVFAGYVALLVRMRNVAAEREMKLTFLPGSAPATYSSYGDGGYGDGGYGDGGGQAAVGYGGSGTPYGELLARRPAN